MTIACPDLEESLRNELRSWLCCALANVLALPTKSTLASRDRASVLLGIARTRHTIDAVLLYASECWEVAQTHTISPMTLAFADSAAAMCRLLEEEVKSVQDTVMNITC